MQITHLLSDSALGLICGYVGTKVMEPVSMRLYELEPEAERQQEDRVRPGPPYTIAAQKTTRLLGLQLSDKQVEQAGLVFHYGLGMSWGPVYPLLRRLTALPPPVAGLLTGASLSLLIDEGLTHLLGTSRAEPRLPTLDTCAWLRCAPGLWPERGRRGRKHRVSWAQQQHERTLTVAP